jgi:thiamine biosynthesis lipoprotein ApbE
VRIGSILRVFGNAPEPDRARVTGWPVAIDPAPDRRAPTERLVLSDRALAMASSWLEPIELGGVAFPPYIDQRAGAPPQRTLTVLVVTELALDAEALAGALFVMSVREGETRLGGLSPPPAVKWLLGRDGPPVVSERRWAALPAWSETPQGP